MIEEYHFGSIAIDGRNYNHDVEVRWTGKVLEWWRAESHLIDVEDVRRAAEEKPEIIIVGTGESGLAQLAESAQNFIKEKGIELIIDKTGEAAKTFNIIKEESEEEEGKERKVIGLFHLTC